ncbi:HlyD family secretion protein [Phormidesmis sp. 146-33]
MEPSNPHSTDSNVEQLSLFAQDADPSSVRRKSWVWLAVLVAIAGGFTIWRFLTPIGKPQAAIAQSQASSPPRAVETTTLKLGNAETRIQLIGQVEASQQSTIRAQTGGVVKQILVQAGDRVEQGATIAVLDDSDQQYAVSEAQARLAQQRSNLARLEVGTRPEVIDQRQAALASAQARERETQDNLRRTKDLVKQGAVSQRLLIEAQTGVDAARGEQLEARAELAEAQAGPIREEIEAQRANVAAAVAALNQAQLSQQRTRVIAPAAGVVQTRRVSQGDLVGLNSELITLVDRSQLDVFLEVPENLGSQVRPGMAVELTTRALPNWKQRATITAIAPTAD